MTKSLMEFAAQANPRKGRVCAACASELRSEIDAGLRVGIGRTTIVRWLREEHNVTDITIGVLDHHRKGYHHQEV